MKKTERKTKTAPVKNPRKTVGVVKPDDSTTSAEPEPGDQLSFKEIKELIELIYEKQFNEFELKRGSFRLHLQKGLGRQAAEPPAQQVIYVPQPFEQSRPLDIAAASPAPPSQPAPAPTPAPQEEKLHIVTSPIVGTFYRASSPTAEPFAKLGDAVEIGKTLCIIEAMKLMNEIQSDATGTVAKIFVENGQPVEYGQPLFGIKV
jgi:acetyl-CoA carboxylase biotin carboxyl carrier protein